jgi:hypothetical protein
MYRPQLGYVGADTFAYQWFLNNGNVGDITVNVNVR